LPNLNIQIERHPNKHPNETRHFDVLLANPTNLETKSL
jgi:hypothetical protein